MVLHPPEAIDAATLAFCASISPAEPLYVPVRPVEHGKRAYCFRNSVIEAQRSGGDAVFGWAIWRWPGRWFEAEHHAVLRSPEGELVDVTPQEGDPPRVLFLPDEAKIYDPRTFRPNIMAADDNPTAAEYIDLVRVRGAITRQYWRPCVDHLKLFSAEDRARLIPIEARMGELLAAMDQAAPTSSNPGTSPQL